MYTWWRSHINTAQSIGYYIIRNSHDRKHFTSFHMRFIREKTVAFIIGIYKDVYQMKVQLENICEWPTKHKICECSLSHQFPVILPFSHIGQSSLVWLMRQSNNYYMYSGMETNVNVCVCVLYNRTPNLSCKYALESVTV